MVGAGVYHLQGWRQQAHTRAGDRSAFSRQGILQSLGNLFLALTASDEMRPTHRGSLLLSQLTVRC